MDVTCDNWDRWGSHSTQHVYVSKNGARARRPAETDEEVAELFSGVDASDKLIDEGVAVEAPMDEMNEVIDALGEEEGKDANQGGSLPSTGGAVATGSADDNQDVPCEVCGSDDEAQETRRAKARYKGHLLDHTEFNAECPGCQAKARSKKHFKGQFDKDAPGYQKMASMDQVSYADFDGALGVGGYRYAMVL